MNARYNIKKRTVRNFCQTILVDLNGQIVESCDTIFSAGSFHSQNVLTWFDLIESIFPSVLELRVGDQAISFAKIHAPSNALPGFYDFSFSKIIIDDKPHILWYIYDYTNVYQHLLEYQQEKNELDIQRQYFEYNNRNISSLEEIQDNRTFFQDNLEVKKSSKYFMLFQKIISSNDSFIDIFKNYETDLKVHNISKALEASYSKISKEVNVFLSDEAELVDEVFDLESITSELNNALEKMSIQHDFQFVLNFNGSKKFIHRQKVLLHIIYSAIINSHYLNANNQTRILFSLEEAPEKSFLKTTILEDTSKDFEIEFSINELYTRLTMLKILTQNHGGNFQTKFEEGSYTLASLVNLPIKLLEN